MNAFTGLDGFGTGYYALAPHYIFGRAALGVGVGAAGVGFGVLGPADDGRGNDPRPAFIGFGTAVALYGVGHGLKGIDYLRVPEFHALRKTGWGRAALATSLGAVPAGVGAGALDAQLRRDATSASSGH
jgi:hypothetical protein